MRTTSNLVNQRFGLGIVLQQVPKPSHLTKNGRYWLMQCDCGNTYIALTESLTSGNSHSCGCKKRRHGKNHPHFRGHEELSLDYWRKLQRGAHLRSITFEVTITQAWDLFVNQNRKCALTGWQINLSKPQTASLDRVDSELPYIVGNIQWVHKDVNRVKQHYQQNYFLSICEAVTKYRSTQHEIRPYRIQSS